MCVIIYREPNVEIPFQKLESACLVNPDGMGIVTMDRGKLHIRKYFWDKGNDPDVVAKALEDSKGLHTYVHLRFKTRGNRDKDNVHPFGVLKQKLHGMDLTFMHNGTLSDFGTGTACDSKDFAKKILTPLSVAFSKTDPGPNGFIHDPTYNAILKKYAGGSSIFLLADNFGNHTIVNADDGKQFEGWWASNEYSFNRYHRTSSTKANAYYTGWERDSDGDYRKMYGNQAMAEADKEASKLTVVTLPKVPDVKGDTSRPFNDEVPFETAKTEAKKENPYKRMTFLEEAGLTSLSDVCGLSKLEVEDMVDEHPDMAVLLILDLLKELYDRDQEYDDRADYEQQVA